MHDYIIIIKWYGNLGMEDISEQGVSKIIT